MSFMDAHDCSAPSVVSNPPNDGDRRALVRDARDCPVMEVESLTDEDKLASSGDDYPAIHEERGRV